MMAHCVTNHHLDDITYYVHCVDPIQSSFHTPKVAPM